MPGPTDRRSRKRLATRQNISDAATRLFMERGFENVTVDQIAEAADVGRMTVFNHFPRKEDMFFDLDEEARQVVRDALRQRDPKISPIETLRLLAHRLVSVRVPYVQFSPGSQAFISTVEASATLMARARAIRDEIAETVRLSLAESVGRDGLDPDARFAANLLVASWTTAFFEAHRIIQSGGKFAKANAVFLAIIDRGTVGLNATLVGTPYAQMDAQKPPTNRRNSR